MAKRDKNRSYDDWEDDWRDYSSDNYKREKEKERRNNRNKKYENVTDRNSK